MIKEFKAQSIIRMNENTERIEICLEKLTAEQVWHRPNENSNSIGNLIIHLCGNIYQYINSSLGETPDIRKRDLEFSTRSGFSKEELLHKIQKTANHACEIIDSFDESTTLDVRSVQGFDLTAIGIILHVVEHYSYHVGQIAFYTKLLKDMDLKFYGDMDLNVKNV